MISDTTLDQTASSDAIDPDLHSPTSIFVKAYDYAWVFDLRIARQVFEQELGGIILEQNPLLVQFDLYRMISMFDYGAVVFFSFPEPECLEILEKLQGSVTRKNRIISEDDFRLLLASPETNFDRTEEMLIEEFNRDIALIVSVILSRSVSLEYYEEQVDRALAKIEETVGELANQGWVLLRFRDLTKQVGFGLQVDLELAYSVTVLDDPDILWDCGTEITRLYRYLKREFDIEDRIRLIREKISIISRSSTFILSRMETQQSLRLEWIIIILIFSEILMEILRIVRPF